MNDKKKSTELVVAEDSEVLFDPKADTQKAKLAADALMDIVKQNGWARRLGGSSEHLQYEAWQTVGKYYNLSVKTGDAKYVEYGGVGGFEATAIVIDNKTGLEVGGAEAICMKDEYNWKAKPLFQLKSMAQTRAGSKALRQLLGFVVALAGYNPTPAEEMIEDKTVKNLGSVTETEEAQVVELKEEIEEKEDIPVVEASPINGQQKIEIARLISKTGKTHQQVNAFVKKWKGKETITKLTAPEATALIKRLEQEVAPEATTPSASEQGTLSIH